MRYKLSLRELAEMFLECGFECTDETVRDGKARFAPLLADKLRAKRKGQLVTPGTRMKRTFVSEGLGNTCSGPSIEMVMGLTLC